MAPNPKRRPVARAEAAEQLRLSVDEDLLAYPLWQEHLLACLQHKRWTAFWLAPLFLVAPQRAKRALERLGPPMLDPWGLPIRASVLAFAEQRAKSGFQVSLVGQYPAIAEALASRHPALGAAGEGTPVRLPFAREKTNFAAFLRLVRPHQWAKNVLLFLPMLLAQRLTDSAAALQVALAFVAFSLCASAVYVFNDLIDVHRDRRHPEKSRRPIPGGLVPLRLAFAAVPLLATAGFTLSATLLSGNFTMLLGIYFAASAWYNLRLSRMLVLDVFALASFYLLRLLAGGEAAKTPLSFWFLAFSLFFFVGLGFLKRYVEQVSLRERRYAREGRAGYREQDTLLLAVAGLSCGVVATFVLTLYVNTYDVVRAYRDPGMLWALCPMVLFWTTRAWFLAHRGSMPFDPVSFALRDRTTWIIAAGCFAVIQLAAHGPLF